MAFESPSPSPSKSPAFRPLLTNIGRSRRGSLASITSRATIDKDILSQALDDIHHSASKTEVLTSFHDYDGGEARGGPKELVSSGVTGLYHLFKQSVSGGPPGKGQKSRPKSSNSRESIGSDSLKGSRATGHPPSGTASLSRPPDAASATAVTERPNVSPSVPTAGSIEDAPDAQNVASRSPTVESNSIPFFSPENPPLLRSADPIGHVRENSSSRPVQDIKTNENSKNTGSDLADGPRTEKPSLAPAKVQSQQELPIKFKSQQVQSLLPDNSSQQTVHDSNEVDDLDGATPSLRKTTNNGHVLFSKESSDKYRNELAQRGMQRPNRPPLDIPRLREFEPPSASSRIDLGGTVSQGRSSETSRKGVLDPSPNFNGALQRKRMSLKPPPSATEHSSASPSVKRRVLDKEFWMLDVNAKVCFSCGQSFSTFRRKHHCRTCGQIFDDRCTSLVPGNSFGQPGTVRLCKPCEEIVLGGDDDSTIFSDDEDYSRSPAARAFSDDENEMSTNWKRKTFSRTDAEVATPSIGIPVSRRNREAKRRSAVIEFDTKPALTRPNSSHSLVSLSRRPRSSSHRRRHSRYQPVRGPRPNTDDRGPFHQESTTGPAQKPSLLTFNGDNLIDPDLAVFLSDEGSDDDDESNIVSATNERNQNSPEDREKNGLSFSYASPLRKKQSRTNERDSMLLSAGPGKDDEYFSHTAKRPSKLARKRNLSTGSLSYGQPFTARSRSNIKLNHIDSPSLEHKSASPPTMLMHSHPALMYSFEMQRQNRPITDLKPASLDHVRRLLSQLLLESKVSSASTWAKALIPVILQCTNDVEPDVQQGDDMDIRHYVKLKKVPGGTPNDTCYVSGVVFSKNIALKTMARSISQPRIAIVTFAIEYARHEAHFMSLEPVIAQEQEYLRNLVNRIVALRPTVLLVQRHVAGLALHMLEKAGITVVYNIKDSVLAAVARVTKTTLIKSIDKLGINRSHLGRCNAFQVKTFVLQGSRKSYIYLSGCEPDLGCTIVLRGSDISTLRRIKRITEFMCYVAYNLKLEYYLMRDEFVSIPETAQAQLRKHDVQMINKSSTFAALGEKTIEISTSSNGDAAHPEDDSTSKYEAFAEEIRSRILSASPFVAFMQPYTLTQLCELEKRLASFKMLRDQYAAADQNGNTDNDEDVSEHFELVKPEMVHVPPSKDQPKTVREYLHAVHEAQLEKATYTYQVQERQWQSFISGDVNPFDPFSHQKIVVLYSLVSSITSAPCAGPELLGIGFYAGVSRVESQYDEDVPLGQYIEDLCFRASTTCSNCNKKMHDHHRQYVHGYGRLSVSIQRQPARMQGYNDTILMWSTCRICRHETTVTQMSAHTWKYSFAKYLELSFWSNPLRPWAGTCDHDVHKDFFRCFGLQDLVVRFQYDPIDTYEVHVPRARVTWRVEADLTVKNEQYSHFVQRLDAFTDSIKKRLDSINVDTLDEKRAVEAEAALDELRKRADSDHDELLEKLQQKYATSRYYELIPLNRALRFMDEKAIAWDEAFSNFERDYFPSETDIRKLASLQLRNMFLESQPQPNSITSDLSDAEDGTAMTLIGPKALERRRTTEQMLSEKAQNVLSSVVHEYKGSMDENKASLGEETTDIHVSTINDIVEKLSPQEEQEKVVERSDVKHLDLAIPARPSEEAGVDEKVDEVEHASSPRMSIESPIQIVLDAHSTPPSAQDSELLGRVEQIRSNRSSEITEQETTESKIPKLADRKRMSPTSKRSPPLLRAKSQPNSVPRLSTDRVPEHNIDSVAVGQSNAEVVPVDRRLTERLGVSRLAQKVGKGAPSLIPRSILRKSDENASSVSALARHFEQMSREFEKERLKERKQRALRSRQSRANPLASSRPIVEVYQNATEAVGEQVHGETNDESEQTEEEAPQHQNDETVAEQHTEDNRTEDQGRTESQSAEDGEAATDTIEADGDVDINDSEPPVLQPVETSDPPSGDTSSFITSPTSTADLIDLSPELSIAEYRKTVWFKYLAEFWSKRSASGWSNLEYPLHSNEHVFEDSDIIVREDEPSSVIALALACADYNNKLKEFRSNPNRQTLAKHSHSFSQSSAGSGNTGNRERDIEASLLSDTGTHMKYSFAHGPVKASCKIFYAESFDALRRRCGVAERFMESMSRCLKFDSKGGKTKSLFLKTLDNRFMIKSLQEVELKAFTKFAPDYFNFMSYTLFHGVPSVIAKMFGVFQVNIRNPATGVDFSYYLLVMENLFYERNTNRRFDLKGSMRNRKIESTGQADEVLLDENLVETIFESPLFVREHSRKLLQASIFNDTLWLCKQNVMDYSLMAGFDDERKELLVGIIDCIRTYTWDKKLESWIKDRGKNKPTITSPKDYRNRFRVSMMQYVLQAPNCWHQFQAQMAPPKTLKEGEKGEMEETEAERI